MTKVQKEYRKKLSTIYARRKITNPRRNIDRLFKSVYPAQHNDYIMLRYPKGYDAPVDAPLYPVVRKLVQLGYRVAGWNYSTTHHVFISVGINKKNKKQNTQNKLTHALADLFDNDCLVHKTNPSKLSDTLIELTYSGNDTVSIRFPHTILTCVMGYLNVKPSTAQVLPGSNAIKMSTKSLQIIHDELVKDGEIEIEDMF